MDNSGLYITYSELILELLNSGSTKVTKSDVTLSNKAIDAGGDIYEYSVPSGAPTPNIGDIILQADTLIVLLKLFLALIGFE
ncbi:MAG: hypothetical protein R2827_03380 [Bdellovibrionales bacterium]